MCDLVRRYGDVSRRRQDDVQQQWVVGQGFQPFNPDRNNRSLLPSSSRYVGKLPNLPIEAVRRFTQPIKDLVPWPSHLVRRKGFERGFSGPRILVARGISRSHSRLRATYTESDFTFQDIIQAIAIPSGEEARAKLLTALLNSGVATWFAFHATASFGSERPEVKLAELLRFPFPKATDLPEPEVAARAAQKLTELIDNAMRGATAGSVPYGEEDANYTEVTGLSISTFAYRTMR